MADGSIIMVVIIDTRNNSNVGPCLVLRSPIMCFRGRLIQDLGNDLRSPIMCFDFGALKI